MKGCSIIPNALVMIFVLSIKTTHQIYEGISFLHHTHTITTNFTISLHLIRAIEPLLGELNTE